MWLPFKAGEVVEVPGRLWRAWVRYFEAIDDKGNPVTVTPVCLGLRTAAMNGGVIPDAPAKAAGAVSDPAPAALFRSAWELERARRAHLICLCIERRQANGKSLKEAIYWPSYAWRSQFFRCDSSRPIRLSRSTLIRLYYQWRRGGKCLAALSLGYPPRLRLPAATLTKIVERVLASKAKDLRAAWRDTPDCPAGYSALLSALGLEARKAIKALILARRRAAYLERVAGKALADRAAVLSLAI